ncbi:hypothetical protein BH20CHL3_BH20CHL3_05260 [soil metagenome]
MKRLDRRKFMILASAGATGAVLTACGNDPDDVELNPTIIPVEGAPPTLAPFATPGGGAVEATPEDGEAGGDANVVELEAEDPYAWSVTELEAAPGQVIVVTNVGLAEHDFVIDDLGINEELPNGEPVEITLPDDIGVGDTYVYYCSVPGHRENGMEGTLTIIEADAAPAEDEEASPETDEASPVADDEATPAESDDAAASDGVAVSTIDMGFEPNELSISSGTDVTVTITNEGVLQHDFVIDELGVDTELLDGGASAEVTINAEPGTYTFYCSVAGHRQAGMEGTLTVE